GQVDRPAGAGAAELHSDGGFCELQRMDPFAYALPSVMVADVIETVPPEAIVELKLSEPEPTAASPSMMTVLAAPLAAVLNGKWPGVRLASPVADVIVLKVSTPAELPAATGFEQASEASLVPVSALNVPAVLPGALPVKISRKAVAPRSVVSRSRRAL